MPGQLKENDCSKTTAVAHKLNPHFPFPNRIDLSRTVKWCHLWSTKLLCYFVLTPLCAQGSLHVCWYLSKDLCTSADICLQQISTHLQIFSRLLILSHKNSDFSWYLPKDLCTSAYICQNIFAHVLIFAHRSLHIYWYLPLWCLPLYLRVSADIGPQIFAPLQILDHRYSYVWYFPKDLCTSADICPQQIFACLLIFAQRSFHVYWYLPKAYICASADVFPYIFVCLLILAHRSSHHYRY